MNPKLIIMCALLLVAFAMPQAQAGFVLGDASNFAVLYEGNGGNTLNYNNSNLTGNLGIGCGTVAVPCSGATTGAFKGSSPGTITGTVEFAAANYGQYDQGGLTITGGATYNDVNVATDLNNLNSLSQKYGGEAGSATTIQNGGSLTASSGVVDTDGNHVFTAAMSSFDAGTTFTINGTAADYVVINIADTKGHGFNGSVVLSGGITSDHVLFNLTKGDYSTLSGGDTLTISTSCASQSCATNGIFLDPNGDFQINHSVLDGRIFGGDTANVSIVSGADIVAPPAQTPEPACFGLLSAGLVALIGVEHLRNRRASA